jgi:opine dehydrogenase
MNIAILGGGNIGTLLAAELASKGHFVSMVVSDPDNWHGTVSAYDKDENLVFEGRLEGVYGDVGPAVDKCEIVFVTYPSFMLERAAAMLLPMARRGLEIGVIPGNGAEFYFMEHVQRGAVLFGLERTHDIARLKERGKSVYTLGRKDGIQVAAIPRDFTHEVAEDMRTLLGMPVVELHNYLVETLTPSNPVLHTSRIRSMFSDWHEGVVYPGNIKFYEEWDLPSSELLLACDDELQNLCRTLEGGLGLDLAEVKSLREHYESPTPEKMVEKLTSISAFKGLLSPMKEVAEG